MLYSGTIPQDSLALIPISFIQHIIMASIHSGQDEEQQAFLRDSHEKDNSCAKHDPAQTHASSSKRGIFRTILEVLMALTIVGLLVETLSRSRSRKSPVPDCVFLSSFRIQVQS